MSAITARSSSAPRIADDSFNTALDFTSTLAAAIVSVLQAGESTVEVAKQRMCALSAAKKNERERERERERRKLKIRILAGNFVIQIGL